MKNFEDTIDRSLDMVFAKNALNALRKYPDLWKDPENYEQIFLVDIDLQIHDITLFSAKTFVWIDFPKYEKVSSSTHLVVHNHPSGNINPSSADFKIDTHFYINYPNYIQGMIVCSKLELACAYITLPAERRLFI